MNKKKYRSKNVKRSRGVLCIRAVYLGPRYLTDLSGNVYMFALRIAYRPASGCRYYSARSGCLRLFPLANYSYRTRNVSAFRYIAYNRPIADTATGTSMVLACAAYITNSWVNAIAESHYVRVYGWLGSMFPQCDHIRFLVPFQSSVVSLWPCLRCLGSSIGLRLSSSLDRIEPTRTVFPVRAIVFFFAVRQRLQYT